MHFIKFLFEKMKHSKMNVTGFDVFLLLIAISWVRASENLLKHFPGAFDELSSELARPADIGLNISQLLNKHGFPLEYHDVETEDGWTLTMHRIPYGRDEMPEANATVKPVIFFGHPLGGCSMNWVFRAPNVSLALQLADEGYDVWLGNTRGNQNSKKHKTFTPKQAEFWNFSFHEKGVYDTAAMIDYVLAYTKVDKLTYVGHSQGTSQILALTSTRAEYNGKFNLVALLSPVAFMRHVFKAPMTPNLTLLEEFASHMKIYGFYQTKLFNAIVDVLCCRPGITQQICFNIFNSIFGFDEKQFSSDIVSLVFSRNLGGLATKELFHFLQEIKSGYFGQYDYGNERNLKVYGSIEPPSYDVSKITAPLAIYYGKADRVGTVKDIEYLKTQLINANIIDDYVVEYETFSHFDFLTAIDIQELLYKRVLSLINTVNKI